METPIGIPIEKLCRIATGVASWSIERGYARPGGASAAPPAAFPALAFRVPAFRGTARRGRIATLSGARVATLPHRQPILTSAF